MRNLTNLRQAEGRHARGNVPNVPKQAAQIREINLTPEDSAYLKQEFLKRNPYLVPRYTLELPATWGLALKHELDRIDRVAVEAALKGFYESRLKIECGLWEKGKAVAAYRGVSTATSFNELEKETGRDREDLKRWCGLYERYPKFEDFLGKYAKPKAKAWTAKALTRQAKLPSSTETPPLPPGAFDVIYADPPWEYDFSQSDSRSIEAHYPTMSVNQIKAIPIPSAKNAVLLLWATVAKDLEAHKVMKAWGFTYRTQAVWDKEKKGMGYWFRGQHELLLVGTKGNVSPPIAAERFSSVIRSPRQEHSRKPTVVYEMIETMFPRQTWIELFQRGKPRPGWVGWGLDLAK